MQVVFLTSFWGMLKSLRDLLLLYFSWKMTSNFILCFNVEVCFLLISVCLHQLHLFTFKIHLLSFSSMHFPWCISKVELFFTNWWPLPQLCLNQKLYSSTLQHTDITSIYVFLSSQLKVKLTVPCQETPLTINYVLHYILDLDLNLGLCLQSSFSTTWATSSIYFVVVILETVFHKVVAYAGIESQSSWSQIPK
jgi:hypothetical protein